MLTFPYDKEKTAAALAYICRKIGGEAVDKYTLLKILYFAERHHLATYGRPITGDRITANTQHGPVPSFGYDMVKHRTLGDRSFEFTKTTVKALLIPDMDLFSESDIESLDISIAENKNLPFPILKKKSHDSAYNKTKDQGGGTMPFSYIAEAGGADEAMLQYIKTLEENQNLTIL